jgi:hypothetical protein
LNPLLPALFDECIKIGVRKAVTRLLLASSDIDVAKLAEPYELE